MKATTKSPIALNGQNDACGVAPVFMEAITTLRIGI
jgi:hypothetical protein